MKTFKLKMLEILNHEKEDFTPINISLIDGLIINREDDQNRWLIEAYIDRNYLDYFTKLKNEEKDIMLQVKITKESNEPAIFITSIIAVNEIGDKMNVLFMGTIVDRERLKIEDLLSSLIKQGFQGDELLRKFKEFT